MSLPFNIAIDGHSSCGKSTIAKFIASKYGMQYIDTGAMYRAVTLYCMDNNIISNKGFNIDKLEVNLDKIYVNFRFNSKNNKSETLLNKKNVEERIRSIDVSRNVSVIAQIKMVRDKLIVMQKEIGKNGNVVMDGRDIGSKVFPEARIKFFVTATSQVRARRRYAEMIARGEVVSFQDVLINLDERDKKDITRSINPLIRSEDAILIDTSGLSISQQDKFVSQIIERKLTTLE